VQFGNENEKLE